LNLRTFPPRSAWAAGSQTQGAGQHQRARVLVPPAVSGEGQLSPDQAQYPVAAEDAGRPAGEDGRVGDGDEGCGGGHLRPDAAAHPIRAVAQLDR